MARLRKMLGSAEHPTVVALMRRMDAQSHLTLIRWVLAEAEQHELPLCRDARLTDAVAAVRRYLAGEAGKASLAAPLKAAQLSAREQTEPAAEAAARAAATACGAARTPTSALGYTFYSAAAYAYARAGVDAPAAQHDALADERFLQLLRSLEAASIPDEANPIQVDWGC